MTNIEAKEFNVGIKLKILQYLPLIFTVITSFLSIPLIPPIISGLSNTIFNHYSLIIFDKFPDKLLLHIVNNIDKPINNLTIIIYPFYDELHYKMINFSNIIIKKNIDYINIDISHIQKYNDLTTITIYSKEFSDIDSSNIYAVSDEGKLNIVLHAYNNIPMITLGYPYNVIIIVLVGSIIVYSVYVILMRKKLFSYLNSYVKLSHDTLNVPNRKAQVLYLLLTLKSSLYKLKPMIFYRDILRSVEKTFDIQLKKDLSLDKYKKEKEICNLINQIEEFPAISTETKDELKIIVKDYAEKNQT